MRGVKYFCVLYLKDTSIIVVCDFKWIYFAGIKNGNECYCMKSIIHEKLWYVEENSNCNMKCKVGESEYLCGGEDSMNVYVAS